MNLDRRIAYFSMEIGLDPGLPTYAGGLGVLAGDTIRSAADLKIPMVAVTLLHRKGHTSISVLIQPVGSAKSPWNGRLTTFSKSSRNR